MPQAPRDTRCFVVKMHLGSLPGAALRSHCCLFQSCHSIPSQAVTKTSPVKQGKPWLEQIIFTAVKGFPPPGFHARGQAGPRACMRRINNTSVWTRVFCWALSLLAQPRCCKAALREHHVHPIDHDCNMQCFVMQPFNAFMQTTVAWQGPSVSLHYRANLP